MTDILERLEGWKIASYNNGDMDLHETVGRAADEIERLRAALRRILDEIHLGGGEYEEPSIDVIHDTANEALGDN